MSLHPQAAAFLSTWNRLNQSPMEEQPLPMLRAALEAATRPVAGCPEPAVVQDHQLATAGGPLLVREYRPIAEGELGVCLYFHGGGWVLNSVDTHDDLARRIAMAGGCTVLSVNYRLAPEHPYPAALDDAFAALLWVDDHADDLNIDNNRIAVCGDSAGGNLAAALCLRTRDQLGPPIRGQALMYPIVDCDFDRPSYHQNADGYFLTRAQMEWFWDCYCPDVSQRTAAWLSPLRAPVLNGLPPALIQVAEYDPLRDEGEAYAQALQAAGVPVQLTRFPGLIHGFCKRVEVFDAAHAALREIGQLLQQTIGPAANPH
jgi:acetyl esterase